MTEWISVKDKLPNFGEQYRYLFLRANGEVTVGYAYEWEPEENGSIWFADDISVTNELATHWMELPNPPEKDGS